MQWHRQTWALDFLQHACRDHRAGWDLDLPGLLSLISPDALVFSGSRASLRSCLWSLRSLSEVLSFGLGARRNCSGNARWPWLWNACTVGFLLLLYESLAPCYSWHVGGYTVCKLITCDRVVAKQLNIFHARRHSQLSCCCSLKDTSPVLCKGASTAAWWERSHGLLIKSCAALAAWGLIQGSP